MRKLVKKLAKPDVSWLRKQPPVFWFLAFLLLGVRFHLFADFQDYPRGDALYYFQAAKNLLAQGFYGKDMPDAGFPPLYPIVLAIYSAVVFAGEVTEASYRSLNLLIDFASFWILARIALNAFGASAWAGLACLAILPAWYANAYMSLSEPLSLLLSLLFLEFALRPGWKRENLAWAGVCLGCLSMTRVMYLYFPIFLAGSIALLRLFKQRKVNVSLKDVGVFLGWSYLPAFLFSIRNAITLGFFGVGQKSTGIIMLWLMTKTPFLDFRNDQEAQAFWNLELLKNYRSHMGTPDAQKYLDQMRIEFFQYLSEHPFEYLLNIGRKFIQLWLTGWKNPYDVVVISPHVAHAYIWAFTVPYVFLGLLGLWNFHREGRKTGTASMPLEGTDRLWWLYVFIFAYANLILAPIIASNRYILIPFVLLGIWIPQGWRFFSRRSSS